MYIIDSIKEGISILCFDKETISTVSKEKSLEEIFLSTLFLNYLLVLVVYVFGLLIGGYSISGRELNMPVFFGLLMIYPFAFNLAVYFLYGFFAIMADMVDSKKHIKPLISVGFHTAIVYAILVAIIGIISTINLSLGSILFGVFMLYFLYTMFLSISTIYNFSFGQSLIVLFTPILLIGILLLVLNIFLPGTLRGVIMFFLVNFI